MPLRVQNVLDAQPVAQSAQDEAHQPTNGACILIICLEPQIQAKIQRGSRKESHPVVMTMGMM